MSRRGAENPLTSCVGFDWDKGNSVKNWAKHRVTPEEAESIFFHEPLLMQADVKHSNHEKRYLLMGDTTAGRKLIAAFTVRKNRIRIISVRDRSRKENEIYAKFEKENSGFQE